VAIPVSLDVDRAMMGPPVGEIHGSVYGSLLIMKGDLIRE
jgi:hypothetical protein